jgi:FixJ family two-component response regulator
VVLRTLAAFPINLHHRPQRHTDVRASKEGRCRRLSEQAVPHQELLDSIQLALDKGSHQAGEGNSSDSN